MKILIICALMVLAGTFGRMGGSDRFYPKWRDVGVSVLIMAAFMLWYRPSFNYWWVYLLCFGLSWACMATYFDKLFNNKDNLFFSGFMVGQALLPVLIIDQSLWVMVFGRSFFLCISWGILNKYLPGRVLLWRRDIVEEFSRYALTCLIIPL